MPWSRGLFPVLCIVIHGAFSPVPNVVSVAWSISEVTGWPNGIGPYFR